MGSVWREYHMCEGTSILSLFLEKWDVPGERRVRSCSGHRADRYVSIGPTREAAEDLSDSELQEAIIHFHLCARCARQYRRALRPHGFPVMELF